MLGLEELRQTQAVRRVSTPLPRPGRQPQSFRARRYAAPAPALSDFRARRYAAPAPVLAACPAPAAPAPCSEPSSAAPSEVEEPSSAAPSEVEALLVFSSAVVSTSASSEASSPPPSPYQIPSTPLRQTTPSAAEAYKRYTTEADDAQAPQRPASPHAWVQGLLFGAPVASAPAWAEGDRVLLTHGVGCGAQAIVTAVAEDHCTVITLDDAGARGTEQVWPSFNQMKLLSSEWRLGATVYVQSLRKANLQHLNGARGVIARHAKHGHPVFVASKGDLRETPQLRLVVQLDDPCAAGHRSVLVEARCVTSTPPAEAAGPVCFLGLGVAMLGVLPTLPRKDVPADLDLAGGEDAGHLGA